MDVSYFNIQRFCLHDGDGIRTTVFLKGCPLSCIWCHNPESKSKQKQLLFYENKCTNCGRCVTLCDARAFSSNNKLIYNRELCSTCGKCEETCFNFANKLCGKTGTTEEIFNEIKKDVSFYKTSGGGLTISGGEPLAQPEAVLELVNFAKNEGIDVAIETSGFCESEILEKLAVLGVTFLYDIKGIDREKHKRNTGVYPDLILKNLEMLFSMNANVIIRLPLIPKINDSENDLLLLQKFLSTNKNHVKHAEIMAYHEFGKDKALALGNSDYEAFLNGKSFCEKWKRVLNTSGVEIKISGE